MERPVFLDVLKAHKAIGPHIVNTPLEYSAPLSDATGNEVWVKWENLQRCGSFKIRGALNKMLALDADGLSRGVVTCSSGNHALGLSLASRMLQTKAVLFVQTHCPEYKQQAIRRLGGDYVELRLEGNIFEKTEEAAQRFCRERGMVYVSSYHDRLVMAGAGTVALEILTAHPDIEAMLFPAGSGGFINGAATAARAMSPDIEIWGVQSCASMPWVVSWESGTVSQFEYRDTLADGLSGYILQDMLDFAKTHITGFLAVEEGAIADAVRFLFEKHHFVIEPSSAVVPAALLQNRFPQGRGAKICAIISGGNADTEIYRRLIATPSNR